MILRFLIGLVLTVFGVALATIHELDAAHSGPKDYSVTVTTQGGGGGGTDCIPTNPGNLCPLTGGSLLTNRGTVTFSKTQGMYGYNVLLNGTTAGLQATALKVTSGLLIAKYDTALPPTGPQTACLQETTQIANVDQPMALFNPVTCPAGL